LFERPRDGDHFDCSGTGQTLNEWVKNAQIDAGNRAGVATDITGSWIR
jgi:hypothetical protein